VKASGAVRTKSKTNIEIFGHTGMTIASLDRHNVTHTLAGAMGLSHSRRNAILRPLFLCLSGLLALTAISPAASQAQSDTAADDRIQQLYAAAKESEARGDVADAVAKYESILKLAPRLGAAYNNLGALYLGHGQYQKAAETLERGLSIDPKMQTALALLGIARYEMGDYPAARKRLEAALRANPKDSNAELYLANALTNLGEPEAAARHLEQVTRREPKNQDAWYRLGKVYVQLAEHAIIKVNEIDPNSVVVHQLSGEIMESMKNYDGALVEYKKAVEMAPQSPGTHLHLGNAYWSLAMWDPATQEFQAELKNDPRNCQAHWKLANILNEQHINFEEALAETDKALALCPDLKEAHLDRARALLRLGRNAEAVGDLKIAIEADPSVSSAHFLLAQAYRAVGKNKEAQAEMQVFSKLEESARAASATRLREVLENKEKPN